ncbi:MAG TPA: heme exporter protein CcmB [Ilumatobacteraceae bacterium]|nr:heme exporter protein CcmB [Ilumatobacteraceae bacterium]
MSTARVALAIAAKDLRIERRSRVMLNQVLPFSGVVMVLFAFALDKANLLSRVAPGLIWMATLFSLLVMVQRSFAVETDDRAFDALAVAGLSPTGLFLGKSLALAVQLLVLDVVLVLLAVVLYETKIHGGGRLALAAVTIVAAVSVLAGIGTLYGGLAAGSKGRDTLLPLLLLPMAAPVVIGATRSMEAAFATGGIAMREGWAWAGLLVALGVLTTVGGALGFSALIEE